MCHAVHYANAAGELLLNSTVAQACTYCHLTSGSGYTQVYGSNQANYLGTDLPSAHNAGIVNGVMCTDCHQVHAAANAMTANNALTQSMLKVPAGSADPSAGVPQSGESTYVAMSKWCADCHYNRGANGMATTSPSGWSNYYNQAYNNRSHTMTTADLTYNNLAATTNTRVAWAESIYCMNCHSAGTAGIVAGSLAKTANYNFPHYTQNAAGFLEAAEASGVARSTAATYDADGVCLSCHRFKPAGATTGIGINF
ncbi:MAG: hypothetical protein FDZ75_03490 [Actinobacteria bacterium]|nr:MAG: hypothetical protein FDZ75_03490 [Actinomycetota bacterium]